MQPHPPLELVTLDDPIIFMSLDDFFQGMRRGEHREGSVLGYGLYVGKRFKNVHEKYALLQFDEGSQYPIVFPNTIFLGSELSFFKGQNGQVQVIGKPNEALKKWRGVNHQEETEPFFHNGNLVKVVWSEKIIFERKKDGWKYIRHV